MAGLLASPFPWVLIAALWAAAALNRALRPARVPAWRSADPERARTAKWVFFTLYLSAAVVAALGAVLVPGSGRIADVRVLYLFAAGVAFFFLVFRFRRSLGPVLLVLAIALVMVVALFLRSLVAFTGETEIGRVRVLSVSQEGMTVEVVPAGGTAAVSEMRGNYFAPVVRVVIFDDYFVFLGARSWYRFEGLTSFRLEKTERGTAFRQQDTDILFPAPTGVSERLWSFYERHERQIPGVRSVQVEIVAKRARELATYSLRIQNDGGLQILEL